MWQMGKVFKDWKVIPLSPAVSEEYDEACNKLTGEMKDLLESFDREIHSRISIIVQMIIQRVCRQRMCDGSFIERDMTEVVNAFITALY